MSTKRASVNFGVAIRCSGGGQTVSLHVFLFHFRLHVWIDSATYHRVSPPLDNCSIESDKSCLVSKHAYLPYDKA